MTELKSLVFRFGIFEVDAQRSELRRGGTLVKLREQSFRILVFLLERAGEIVTREELRQGLWPSDTYVDFEHSLNTAIMKLRDALGDSADKPLYIETIPKRGYRFVAPVTVPPARQDAMPSSQGENAIATSERPGGGESEIADLSNVLPPERAKGLPPERAKGLPPERAKERHRYFLLGIAMASVVVIALCVVAVARRWQSPAPYERGQSSGAVPGMRSVVLVSVTGYLRDPVLSPDGKQIAYVWNEEGVASNVYVQLVGGDKADQRPLRLTQTKGGFTCCTSWSPDQAEIAFGRCDDKGGAVFIVPALGGPARKVADVTCVFGEAGWPIWTHDGKSLILLDQCSENAPQGIVLLSLSSGEKRCLHRPTDGEIGDLQPAISPDQNTVAFIRFSTVGFAQIETLRLNEEEKPHVVVSGGNTLGGLMWTADGGHIVFLSSRGGLAGVWRVPTAGGAAVRETVYPAVGSLSKDGRRLVYVQNPGNWPTTIVRAELSGAGGRVLRTANIISSASETDSPQLSPDGKQMAYGVAPAGNGWWGGQIWKSKADGSDPTQLTSLQGYAGTAHWSPDGRSIAFDYRPGPHGQIFIMDAEGRRQRAVAANEFDLVVPSWSRDGTAIYFCSNRTGRYEVWKKNLTTGLEMQITHHGGFAPSESYDGSTLYYTRFDGAGIWSMPVQGGDERKVTDAPHLGYWGHFALTDTGIYLLDTEYAAGPTILFYRFQSHELVPVMTLTENPLPWGANLSASRDGKTLLFAEYKVTRSITMVEYPQ